MGVENGSAAEPAVNGPVELSQDEAQKLWNEEATRRSTGDNPLEQAGTENQGTEKAPNAEETPPKDEPGKAKKEAAPPPTLEERFAALEQTLKATQGRVAALQREKDLATQAAKEAAAKGNEAPDKAQRDAALKNPEKWASLKEEFPEWASATEELLAANLAGQAGPKGLSQEEVQQALQTRELARIERKHPGWQEKIQTPEFLAWREQQPDEVKALGASEFAEDAIEMLDLFAGSAATKTPEEQVQDVQRDRAARLAAAATPASRRLPTPPPRTEQDLTPQEIWAQEAAARMKQRAAEGA